MSKKFKTKPLSPKNTPKKDDKLSEIDSSSFKRFNKYCDYVQGEKKAKSFVLYGLIGILILMTVTIIIISLYGVTLVSFFVPLGILIGIMIFMSYATKVKCDKQSMLEDVVQFKKKMLGDTEKEKKLKPIKTEKGDGNGKRK